LKTFISDLEEHQSMIERLKACSDRIETASGLLINTLKQGGKLLLCGNGGSAADCQHIAAEFVVRYEKQRRALAAIALTTDTSILTAHANDYEFETVFSRQVEALATEKDCLIAISTSGKSKNVLKAVEAAILKGMPIVALSGGEGGELVALATVSIIVPSNVTARIQEAHILIGHWWCGIIEQAFSEEAANAGNRA